MKLEESIDRIVDKGRDELSKSSLHWPPRLTDRQYQRGRQIGTTSPARPPDPAPGPLVVPCAHLRPHQDPSDPGGEVKKGAIQSLAPWQFPACTAVHIKILRPRMGGRKEGRQVLPGPLAVSGAHLRPNQDPPVPGERHDEGRQLLPGPLFIVLGQLWAVGIRPYYQGACRIQ